MLNIWGIDGEYMVLVDVWSIIAGCDIAFGVL